MATNISKGNTLLFANGFGYLSQPPPISQGHVNHTLTVVDGMEVRHGTTVKSVHIDDHTVNDRPTASAQCVLQSSTDLFVCSL